MQRHVPAEKLARVYSYDALGSFLAIPLGQMAAGPLAQRFGTAPVVVAGAALVALTVGAMLASPGVRRLDGGPVVERTTREDRAGREGRVGQPGQSGQPGPGRPGRPRDLVRDGRQ